MQNMSTPKIVKLANVFTSALEFSLAKLAIFSPTKGRTQGIKFSIIPENKLKAKRPNKVKNNVI